MLLRRCCAARPLVAGGLHRSFSTVTVSIAEATAEATEALQQIGCAPFHILIY